MKKVLAIIIAVAVLGVIIYYVTKPHKQVYGQALDLNLQVMPVEDILKNPKGHIGRQVVVQGRITSECPAGGWFWLNDGTGEIYVNLHPSNFAIPQKVGAAVKAQGTVVETAEGKIEIVGKGVEL